MKRILLTPIVAVLFSASGLLLSAAAADDTTKPNLNNPNTTDRAAQNAPAANAGKTTADAAADGKFFQSAWYSSTTEVKAGKIAQDRSKREDIQAYGKTLEKDHKQLNDDLDKLAEKANVKLPDELDAMHQQTLDKLQKCNEADFDRMFLESMVMGHKDAVKLFQDRAENSKEADIKTFANRYLPILKTHLSKAETLQKGIGAPGTASIRR